MAEKQKSKVKVVKFAPSKPIEDVVEKLFSYKEKGETVEGYYNGKRFLSDTVTVDSVYMEIFGCNKQAFKEELEKKLDSGALSSVEYKQYLPLIIQIWSDRGKEIIRRDKWSLWESLVPYRINEKTMGKELGECLELIKVVDSGEFDKATSLAKEYGKTKEKLEVLIVLLKLFAIRGVEFEEFL